MHRPRSAAWRFEDDNAQFLHLALFVRDATRLAVPPSAEVPPHLAGGVPDLAEVLSAAERAAAAEQWVSWWHRLMDQAAREARQRKGQAGDQDPMAQLRARFAGREEVFDPPEFGSLADMQPLRSAAVATFAEAVKWSDSPERNGRPERERFAWPLVRSAAESAAAELGIPVGDLDAVAHLLDVEGAWSHLAGPGCGLCSAAVAADPLAARLLLHDLFTSGPGDAAAIVR